MNDLKIIAHIDMDAFFAAIEERENSRYAGLPIVIGADPKGGMGRGVVSTANYAARKYGIFSAMPISAAWRLAREGKRKGGKETIFLPVNHDYYSEVSGRIMDIIKKQVEIVEQVSIDEAYMDLSFAKDYTDAIKLVKALKNEIKEKEKLTASVGIGPNKLIAKLASAKNKPDGLTIVEEKDAESFISMLRPRDIPGIGPKTEEKLHKKGIYSIENLKKENRNSLIDWFGKWGSDIYEKVRGIDNTELSTSSVPKSISEQETYEKDTFDSAFLLGRINHLSQKVHERMVDEGISGFRTVGIVVRFADFTTMTRVKSLGEFSGNLNDIKNISLKLFLPFLDSRENPHGKKIRLLGVKIENLELIDHSRGIDIHKPSNSS